MLSSAPGLMRVGAERGLKRYIDHLDEIDDPKALGIIRKNLEAKQDEMQWYDDQVAKEREDALDTKLETTKDKAKELEDAAKENKKGGIPFPLIVAVGAVGAAAYFLLRRGEESDYDDYGEDAFRYEGEDTGTGTTDYSSGDFGGASTGA